MTTNNTQQRTSLGYVQITDLAASTPLVVPLNTAFALIQAEAQAIRWRDDGTAPTGSIGMTIAAGAELRYDSRSIDSLRLIQATAGAIANITFYAAS